MGERLDEGLLLDLILKRRAGKFTGDELLWAADHPKIIRYLMKRPKTAARIEKLFFPSQVLAADLIPSGWGIVEDVEPTLKSVADLEFISFLEPGESGVSGKETRKRAKKLGANLGLVDLKFLLEHQDEIPVDMRRFDIIFPGTVLWREGHEIAVLYLRWYDSGHWGMSLHAVFRGWYNLGRLPRCKSAKKPDEGP